MCLTAGVVAPFATVVLVIVTLTGALPVYRRVARESPHGEGPLAILEKTLPAWGGKPLVLVLPMTVIAPTIPRKPERRC